MPPLRVDICPEFTQYVYSSCRAEGILTVADFVIKDPEELAKKIKVSFKDVLSIQRALLANFAPFPQNAISLHSELLESISILNTGSKRLNRFLSGGIYTGEVTEIYGSPGSGKTQFCFSVISHLLIETKFTAFYLDTGCTFDARRIYEIMRARSNEPSGLVTLKLKNLKVASVPDVYTLFDCLDAIKAEVCKNEMGFFKCLRLVVIDSVTPLLSSFFGEKCLDGPGMISNVAQQFNVLCHEHKLSIIVCNNTVQSQSSEVKPALGANWKFVPSVSLCVSKARLSSRKIKANKSCRNGLFTDADITIDEGGIDDI